MTFKEYLQKASQRDIYDDGHDFDFETIFAREVLKYAHDEELATKEAFFSHLKSMEADRWFIQLARLIFEAYQKSLED